MDVLDTLPHDIEADIPMAEFEAATKRACNTKICS